MSIQESNQLELDSRGRIYREASRTALLGLAGNVVLVAIKLTGGIVTGSSALLADAVNSIGDVTSSLLVRGALWLAQRDADEHHPYGHTKAESIAGLTVSLLIVMSSAALMVEIAGEIGQAVELTTFWAAIIAICSAALKEIMYRFTVKEAKRVGSSSLLAVAWDHRADAISSSIIAAALLLGWLAGPAGFWIDRLAGLGMCLVLIVVGSRLYWRAARELMDQQADPEMVRQIADEALKTGEVDVVETLRVRKSGLEFFVEIHLEVDGAMSVEHGHRVGHQVKDQLLAKFPRIRDVHVHVEPHER